MEVVYKRYYRLVPALLLLTSLGVINNNPVEAAELFQCPRAILGLGDSYTDTGELIQAFTGVAGFDAAERFPYGVTYFGRPVDRSSDGRLIIDFFCKLQMKIYLSAACNLSRKQSKRSVN